MIQTGAEISQKTPMTTMMAYLILPMRVVKVLLVGHQRLTDYDSDGCRDSSEDADDDNDGITDSSDACSKGTLSWTSSTSTDHDGDGCRDSTEDNDDDNDLITDTLDTCPIG